MRQVSSPPEPIRARRMAARGAVRICSRPACRASSRPAMSRGAGRRVASAVGEAAVAVQLLHQFFALTQQQPRGRLREEPLTVR